MNVAVLTTDAIHHCWFVRELSKFAAPALVMAERNGARPPFETRHAIDDERDRHERAIWFGGCDVRLADIGPIVEVESANDPEAVAKLASAAPDIVIVFGTRRLDQQVIDVCPRGMLNLHGGDPRRYRGLDSHLWAVYHGDYGALVTTLHRVNARLDDGDVVAQAPVPLAPGTALHELRSRSTEVCVELVRFAVESYSKSAALPGRRQRQRGRYYSFMPAVLKEVCRRKFECHTGAMP